MACITADRPLAVAGERLRLSSGDDTEASRSEEVAQQRQNEGSWRLPARCGVQIVTGGLRTNSVDELRQATTVLAVTVQTCGRVGDYADRRARKVEQCWAGLRLFSDVAEHGSGYPPRSEAAVQRLPWWYINPAASHPMRHRDTSDHLDDSDV
ncbi:hypothetical protein HPB52_007899 [Rhipicephalus sanguineus]|uniref:Uncharacterized protein n=1 Tax=Rhipicephalus sanguineus TaxID=34632 RepID=A0A9D4PW79_RHISA|nr:hypothetical protein HPB52_007899 [Rhipicephalus sanguineus]